MRLYFSQHSEAQMKRREILEEWVYVVIANPDYETTNSLNSNILYKFKRIKEANNKVLRVVLKNMDSDDEYLIITCYFDRKMRNNL